MNKFIDLHVALVDAIEAGDADTVRRRLHAHFEEPLAWSEAGARDVTADFNSILNVTRA
jgi:DNA-binding GntR family transcriptional regulator